MSFKLPPKPYETFPLFAHAKGYWAKKIKGRQVSFGSWEWPDVAGYERSWKAALKEFHKYDEQRAMTRTQRARPERLTIGELVDAYLANMKDRFAKREVSARHLGDCMTHLEPFVAYIGANTRVTELEDQPQLLQKFLKSRSGDRWHAYNRLVAILSSCFAWAEHPIDGLLRRPFALRPLLKKRSAKLLRRAKREDEASRGKKRWTPMELAALFRCAPTTTMLGWLHLGYFCAFGNSDIADLPRNAISFDPPASSGIPAGMGSIHFPRPKTEIERAAVLPAATVEVLKQCMAIPRKPAEPRFKSLVFITRYGLPYVREVIETDEAGEVEKVIAIDQVANQFQKFRDRVFHCECGHAASFDGSDSFCVRCRKGLKKIRAMGFYTFRHTGITYASGVADVDALHRWRGHALAGMSNTYVEEIENQHLATIAVHLQKRLDDAMNPISGPSTATPQTDDAPLRALPDVAQAA